MWNNVEPGRQKCIMCKLYIVGNQRLKAILTLTEKTSQGYELSAICTVGR